MKKIVFGTLFVVLVLAGLWWSTGRGPGFPGKLPPPHVPLAFAPADTPFVFANLEPLPRAVLDKTLRQMAETAGMYGEMLEAMRADLAASDKPEARRVLAVLDALVAEFEGKTPEQINQTIGFGMDSRIALYGLGLVPVLRIEVAQPDNLRALITRMETAAGEALPRAGLDAIEYWSVPLAEAPLTAIAAILDGHLVATLAPASATPEVLRKLLGLVRPDRSLRDGGELESYNRELGFLPYFSGYLDTARLLAAITDAGNEVEQAFATALGVPRPQLDATCVAEYQALAAAWPRIGVGYTRFDPDRNDMRLVMETRKDIAAELVKLRAPMPGVGLLGEEAIAHLGLSLKLSALPEVTGHFARAAAAAPWQCEQLAFLNDGFDESSKAIANPAVFAAAPVFSGFHAIIHTLDVPSPGTATEPTGTGVLLIGSDNPASLIGMAKGFVPQLADIDVPADGRPVPVPLLPMMPPDLRVHVARSDHVIALGVGDATRDVLTGLLQPDPTQQPLLVAGVSAKFYELLADTMSRAADASATNDEERAKVKHQAELMRRIYATTFKRMEMRVELSERGIELLQTMEIP